MTDWQVRSSAAGASTLRWQLLDAEGRALGFDAVIRNWRESAAFRMFWRERLLDVAFDAYAWECPPLTASSAARDFECIFVRYAALARMPPDRDAFARHFRPGCRVVTFANLGGDAMLVAPCPGDADANFPHLASFAQSAPDGQQDALWQAVGEAMAKRIGTRPVWLSTAGGGVAWLHVRLDDRPKYYRHLAYAQ